MARVSQTSLCDPSDAADLDFCFLTLTKAADMPAFSRPQREVDFVNSRRATTEEFMTCSARALEAASGLACSPT